MAISNIINLLDFTRDRRVRRVLRGKVLRPDEVEELLASLNLCTEVIAGLKDESSVRDRPVEWREIVGRVAMVVLGHKNVKVRRVARDMVELHGISEPPELLDALVGANEFGALAAVTGDQAIV